MTGPGQTTLWLFNDERREWVAVGTGTELEMRTAAESIRAVAGALGETPPTTVIADEAPRSGPASFPPAAGDDRIAAELRALRVALVAELAGIRRAVEPPT